MPNQRAKNKVPVGGYVDRAIRDEMRKLAAREGVSVTELLVQFLRAGLAAVKRGAGGGPK